MGTLLNMCLNIDIYDICLEARFGLFRLRDGRHHDFTNASFYSAMAEFCRLPEITRLTGDLARVDKDIVNILAFLPRITRLDNATWEFDRYLICA